MASARNNVQIESVGAPSGAAGDDATYCAAWDSAASGKHLFNVQISTNPDALILGARYQIPAQGLVYTETAATGESDESVKRKLRGLIAGGWYISWHTGDPGANGTSNHISEIPRTRITEAQLEVV